MLNRDQSIDFLRGSAILFMTITHVNAVYYLGSNSIMNFFTTIGATVCFSVFLFCSAYIVGLRIKEGKEISNKNLLEKSFKLYLVYIVISLLVTLTYYKEFSLQKILEVILLINPPEFAEFLISLAIFTILTILLKKTLKKLQGKGIILILLAIFSFIIGNILYLITTDLSFTPTLQIFIENAWGYSNLHRFPILMYLPIYLFGILLSQYPSKMNLLISLQLSASLIVILNIFNLSNWHRWPPSVLFLTYGVGYISLVLYMFKRYPDSRIFNSIAQMGKYPLEQFLLSTSLIFLPLLLIQPNSNIYTALVLNFLVILSLALHPIVFHRKMV